MHKQNFKNHQHPLPGVSNAASKHQYMPFCPFLCSSIGILAADQASVWARVAPAMLADVILLMHSLQIQWCLPRDAVPCTC